MWIYLPEDPADAAKARADIVANDQLSFGAIGLLLVILDHAPEWDQGPEWEAESADLSRRAQVRHGERGEDPKAAVALIFELVAHGYIVPVETNGDGGVVRDAEVYAIPRVTREGDKQQVVYVIGQPGKSERRIAKVGTTTNLRARLRAIQTGHPFRLEVLWSCPGGRRLESWLHEGLAPRRLEGEWFDFEEFDPALVVRDGVRTARRMGIE